MGELLKWAEYFERKARIERGEQDPTEMSPKQLAQAFGANVGG